MNYTTSEENYLKAIFHLQEEGDNVTTNALAEKLNTRAASVTDMMKKLSAKKLLHYKNSPPIGVMIPIPEVTTLFMAFMEAIR